MSAKFHPLVPVSLGVMGCSLTWQRFTSFTVIAIIVPSSTRTETAISVWHVLLYPQLALCSVECSVESNRGFDSS